MKQKTHKATAKRVRKTGSGKLVRLGAARSHLLTNKSARTKLWIAIAKADRKKVKKLAPYLD